MTSSSSPPPLARAPRRPCFALQRVHAAWAWWTTVNCDDPLRHALNQRFLYIVTTWLLLGFAGIISLATSLIVIVTMVSLLLDLHAQLPEYARARPFDLTYADGTTTITVALALL